MELRQIRNNDRCFLEIGHHIDDKQISYNAKMYELSTIYGLRLIAGTDTHVLNEEHEKGRKILQLSKNIIFDGEDNWDLKFKTYDELVRSYEIQQSLPEHVYLEAIENTNVMADMVESFEIDRGTKYPQIYKDPEKVFREKIDKAVETHPYAVARHGREVIDRVVADELAVYEKTGSVDFMLLQTYLREWELSQGIQCGYGRGSVSGSMIAYLLGITKMDMKLSEIKPVKLNSIFAAMTKDGARKDGRSGGYSRGTIKKTQDILSSILRTAVDWEILERNPMDKVRVVGENPADKIEFFTPDQASAFLNFIERPYKVKTKGHKRIDDTGKEYTVGNYESERELPEQIKVLFNLAIYGGLRKGELLALEWSDIDFENNTISISKSTSVVKGEQIIKEPKTKNSRRVVSIPSWLTRRIRAMKLDRTKYRLTVGDYWQGAEWLFVQDNGKQMSYYTPYSAFSDTIARYNKDKEPGQKLPQIPFHGLRHTSATLLIAGKQDVKTVAARLGHAQTSTTMNIYVHALKEADKASVDAIEGVLRKQAR